MSLELFYDAGLAGKQHRVIHTANAENEVLVTGNLDPSVDLQYSIGHLSARWVGVHAETLHLLSGNIEVGGVDYNIRANTVVDHSAVEIVAGNGLAGGGDLTETRTIDLAINELATDSAPDGLADFTVFYDSSTGEHKKVILNDLPVSQPDGENLGVGVGVFAQTVLSTLQFNTLQGNTGGIDVSLQPNSIIQFDLDIDQLPDAPVAGNVEYVAVYDAIADVTQKRTTASLPNHISAGGATPRVAKCGTVYTKLLDVAFPGSNVFDLESIQVSARVRDDTGAISGGLRVFDVTNVAVIADISDITANVKSLVTLPVSLGNVSAGSALWELQGNVEGNVGAQFEVYSMTLATTGTN